MWIFGRKQEHRESGWQRERNTGEIAIVHQRPQPIYDPQPQPQPTGAMMRQWLQTHPPAPARSPNTDRMRQLSRPTGIDPRDWSEVPTAKKLPGLDWLEKQLPAGALPVRRPVTDRPNAGQKTDISRTEDTLGFADLPTWLAPSTIEARISAALPPLPDDGAWLNSEPLRLTPLPEQSIASTDRTATSAFALSEQECTPDLSDEDDATMAQENRALYQLRLMARKQESEK